MPAVGSGCPAPARGRFGIVHATSLVLSRLPACLDEVRDVGVARTGWLAAPSRARYAPVRPGASARLAAPAG